MKKKERNTGVSVMREREQVRRHVGIAYFWRVIECIGRARKA